MLATDVTVAVSVVVGCRGDCAPRYLDVGHNTFTGSILPSLSVLSNLVYVHCTALLGRLMCWLHAVIAVRLVVRARVWECWSSYTRGK